MMEDRRIKGEVGSTKYETGAFGDYL